MEVVSNPDKKELLAQAKVWLTRQLEAANSQPVLLLCSGGSAFDILMEDYSAVVTPEVKRNLTVGVLDERFDQDPQVNNFAHLMTTRLFHDVLGDAAQAIDSRVKEGQSHQAHGMAFEKALRTWRITHPNGLVAATLGMGGDGHTSGMMPRPDDQAGFAEAFESDRWVASYDASGADQRGFNYRTTTTMTFLQNHVDKALIWVMGEGKKAVLSQVLAQEGTLATLPALVFHQLPENSLLLTDQAV